MRVLESGVGSGALSMTMLRWGAEIVGYELREDFANRAKANVRSFLGEAAMERYHVELRDCYDGIDERDDRSRRARPARAVAGRAPRDGGAATRWHLDRLHAVDHPGVAATREALASKAWNGTESGGAAPRLVRRRPGSAPDHRMVAHTGFLTTARFLG